MEHDNKILLILVSVLVIVFVTNLPASISEIKEIVGKMDERISFAEENIESKSLLTTALKVKNFENRIWDIIKGTEAVSEEKVLPEKVEISKTTEEPKVSNEKENDTNKKIFNLPLKLVMLGDSMIMVGFGPNLEEQLLAKDQVTVLREGKFSTGLNRIDYFDWYSRTEELIQQNNPDILIVMFGANDGQGIVDENGVAFKLSDPKWDEVYQRRVFNYMTRFSSKVKKIYWVGHPISLSPDFGPKFTRMNKIYLSESEKFENIEYIDMWERFMVNGKYASALPSKNGKIGLVKQSDDVHMTEHGGLVMAEYIMGILSEDINW